MQELKFIKVARFFLENPYEEVYLRELAKKLKVSPFAIKKYSDLLLKEGLIIEERKANLRYFKANLNSIFYRHLKISINIQELLKSGLIEFIKEGIANLSSIVLFGSTAKGEDDKKSDMDLLIIGKHKYLELHKFEDSLNKKITLHIFSWSEWIQKAKQDNPFYFEIINHGIALQGDLPLVRWK